MPIRISSKRTWLIVVLILVIFATPDKQICSLKFYRRFMLRDPTIYPYVFYMLPYSLLFFQKYVSQFLNSFWKILGCEIHTDPNLRPKADFGWHSTWALGWLAFKDIRILTSRKWYTTRLKLGYVYFSFCVYLYTLSITCIKPNISCSTLHHNG